MRKNKHLFAFLLFVVCFLLPMNASAVTNPTKVTLVPGITYSSYDITGDQKADKILVTATKYNNYAYKALKIKVNGKTAFTLNDYFYQPSITLYTLRNHKVVVEIAATSDNYDFGVEGLFLYRSGELKKIVDYDKSYPYGGHVMGCVNKVAGNTLTVNMGCMSWAVAWFNYPMSYTYKDGTLKQSTHTVTPKLYRGKNYTMRYSLPLYKSKTSKAKAFTLSARTKVTIQKVYIKGKNIRFKIKRRSDGKTGWAISPKKYIKRGPWFKETMYAG